MSVYVDRLVTSPGWRYKQSCHMIADSLEELHAMADAIGHKRGWFQKRSFPHYDMVASRRTLAVKLGAIECDRYQFVAHMKRIRKELSNER